MDLASTGSVLGVEELLLVGTLIGLPDCQVRRLVADRTKRYNYAWDMLAETFDVNRSLDELVIKAGSPPDDD